MLLEPASKNTVTIIDIIHLVVWNGSSRLRRRDTAFQAVKYGQDARITLENHPASLNELEIVNSNQTKTLTIHNLNQEVRRQLERRAKEESVSLNDMVINLLTQALGMKSALTGTNRQHFEEFCGSWTHKEAADFKKNTEDLNQVDLSDS